MSINRGMDKEDVVHIYNGKLLSHKKEWNNGIYSYMFKSFRELCGEGQDINGPVAGLRCVDKWSYGVCLMYLFCLLFIKIGTITVFFSMDGRLKKREMLWCRREKGHLRSICDSIEGMWWNAQEESCPQIGTEVVHGSKRQAKNVIQMRGPLIHPVQHVRSLEVTTSVLMTRKKTEKSTTLLRSIGELRSEGKALPPKLRRHTGGYRGSQPTKAEPKSRNLPWNQ